MRACLAQSGWPELAYEGEMWCFVRSFLRTYDKSYNLGSVHDGLAFLKPSVE